MKVKVGNRVYESRDQPIMVILTKMDKLNIANMDPDCTKYAEFLKDLGEEWTSAWMEDTEVRPSIAEQVKAQIVEHYTYEGKYYQPGLSDLSKHLTGNCVDTGVPLEHKHKGFDRAEDGSLCVIYYEDSCLVLTFSEIIPQ